MDDNTSRDSSTPTARRIVVVGAGITGLAAAFAVLRADPRAKVTVIEQSPLVGGQVRAIDVAGSPVDVGAEAIHLGAPDAAALVRELGLDETVIGARPGTSLLLTRKGLRPLPAGVGPTGPTKVGPVLKSGILSPAGLVRAGLEPLMRRRYPDDMAVADFVQMRFGREVVETFVDPLLGNLHSGNVHALSMRATAKQLVPTAASGKSLLMKALRKPPAPVRRPDSAAALPMFASWPGGLTTLVDALVERILAGGGEVRTGVRVLAIEPSAPSDAERGPRRWRVATSEGPVDADDVIVTAGPRVVKELVSPLVPAVGTAMQWVRTASVATVVLAFDKREAQANQVLREANGVLLTSRQAGVMKAMTNMSRKWAPLDACPWHVLRLSVGRSTNEIANDLDDQQMVSAVVGELGSLIGLDAEPRFSAVVRWPQTMPQLGVGHVERVAEARAAALAGAPGLHLAGAAVDGLGLTATISSGLRAGRHAVSR